LSPGNDLRRRSYRGLDAVRSHGTPVRECRRRSPRATSLRHESAHAMTIYRRVPQRISTTAIIAALLLAPAVALASPGGAGLPWESTFETILSSMQGIATPIITIAIIVAAFALMFGEAGGMSRKVVGIVVGGAGALGAAGVVSTLFESGSGLLF
jgi:type IV secretory pathway VirB2 component (pilin)